MNCIKKTSIPGMHLDSSRIKQGLLMKLLNTPWQYDTSISTITYTYNDMTHLNNRMLDLCLFLKDFTIIIIWGKMVAGEEG